MAAAATANVVAATAAAPAAAAAVFVVPRKGRILEHEAEDCSLTYISTVAGVVDQAPFSVSHGPRGLTILPAISADGLTLQLTSTRVVSTRDEVIEARHAARQNELQKRRTDADVLLKEHQEQVTAILEEGLEPDDDLAIKMSEKLALAGKHKKSIREIEAAQSIGVAYTVSSATATATLEMGKPTQIPASFFLSGSPPGSPPEASASGVTWIWLPVLETVRTAVSVTPASEDRSSTILTANLAYLAEKTEWPFYTVYANHTNPTIKLRLAIVFTNSSLEAGEWFLGTVLACSSKNNQHEIQLDQEKQEGKTRWLLLRHRVFQVLGDLRIYEAGRVVTGEAASKLRDLPGCEAERSEAGAFGG